MLNGSEINNKYTILYDCHGLEKFKDWEVLGGGGG